MAGYTCLFEDIHRSQATIGADTHFKCGQCFENIFEFGLVAHLRKYDG